MINEKDRTITVKAHDLRELYRAYSKIYERFDSKFYDVGIRDSHDFVMGAITYEFEEKLIQMLGLEYEEDAARDLHSTLYGVGFFDDMPKDYDYDLIEFIKEWKS